MEMGVLLKKEPTMVEKRKSIMKKIFKKGIVTEYLPWLLIAILVLVVVLISIFLLKDKGISLIDQIKNLFRRG